MTELERVLITKIQELDEKAENADDYFKWYMREREKREELEKKLEELTMAESDENV